MKRQTLKSVLRVICFSLFSSVALAQDTVTLDAPRFQGRDYCFNFRSGLTLKTDFEACELRYGTLRIGEDWDWLQSSKDRHVIKDLGKRSWSDKVELPPVSALELPPVERRVVEIHVVGADGADAPGARKSTRPKPPRRYVDPIYAKAIVGHMYVVLVPDDDNYYYALFRVESIARGTSCTISWKLFDGPKRN